MNLIKSLMGRRQFLIATGVASTCALTCKKLAGFINRDFQANAMAAERAATASLKAAGNRCPHLLSPLRIRNVVLKNRIMTTPAPPHCLQGPENFPTDAFRNHYSNLAKNAAIVSLDDHFGQYPITYGDVTDMHSGSFNHHADHIWQDIPPVYNYVNRLIEDMHCEGALVRYVGTTGGGGGMGGGMPGGGSGEGGAPSGGAMPEGMEQGRGMMGGEMPEGMEQGRGMMGGEMPEGMGQGGGRGGMPGGGQGQTNVSIKDIVAEAKEIEDQGYDVYQMGTNNVEAIEAVKSATNLIIMSEGLPMSGGGMGGRDNTVLHPWVYEGSDLDWGGGPNSMGVGNNNQPTAAEIEQAVESARQLEGLVDFVLIRLDQHPNAWTQDKGRPRSLAYAEAIKKAGIDLIVCPAAGFHDTVMNDDFIASGKCDMIGMTTPFFADPELVKKASEGRPEDIVPCIQCHNCHGISRTHGPWYDTCTVSPEWATPMYKLKNIPAPTVSKKVAVIGGGPGGMKAALVAADRGHKVTLFEKSGSLGGLLKFTDYSQWKWTYKDFKDYLITQVNKQGIDVKLNTTATPEMIESKGYDTVLVATGAEPVMPRMSGADASNVFNILTAYSNKKALGKNVVVIGAGRIGTECALGLAKDGHKVMILCSSKNLIELEFIGPHNMMNQITILQNHPNLDFVLEATAKSITGGKVIYADSEGNEKSIEADSVVIYAGLKPRMDEAMKFRGSADQVLLLGDCTGKNGTIQKTIRSAFFVASQV